MGRIGLFGGTFDPVHSGHIAVCSAAKERLRLDSIVLLPAGDPPHKTKKAVTDKRHRLKMTELAFAQLDGCVVSDYEIKKTAPSYSVETLRHFRGIYKNDELYFIIGADSFADLPLWWHYRELMDMCALVVVSRPDADKSALFAKFDGDERPPRVYYLDNVCCPVSSTMIRAMIRDGKDVSALLPETVRRYIEENRLYLT